MTAVRLRKAQVDAVRELLREMPWLGSLKEFVDHAIADKVCQARAARRPG